MLVVSLFRMLVVSLFSEKEMQRFCRSVGCRAVSKLWDVHLGVARTVPLAQVIVGQRAGLTTRGSGGGGSGTNEDDGAKANKGKKPSKKAPSESTEKDEKASKLETEAPKETTCTSDKPSDNSSTPTPTDPPKSTKP